MAGPSLPSDLPSCSAAKASLCFVRLECTSVSQCEMGSWYTSTEDPAWGRGRGGAGEGQEGVGALTQPLTLTRTYAPLHNIHTYKA